MSSDALSDLERQKVAARLRTLRQEHYRRARWTAIDAARKAGMTWEEIGNELGVLATAASRMYTQDKSLVEGARD